MVLSYLASYVYPTSASSNSSNNNGINGDGPQPTRANSVRRTAGGSRSQYTSSRRNGAGPSRFATTHSTIPEDDDDNLQSAGNHCLPTDDPALAIIHHINTAKSFYDVVGVPKNFKTNEELRRAYMARCRLCHPE